MQGASIGDRPAGSISPEQHHYLRGMKPPAMIIKRSNALFTCFFALTAAALVIEQTRNRQKSCSDDDDDLRPGRRPPNDSYHENCSRQYEAAETEFHRNHPLRIIPANYDSYRIEKSMKINCRPFTDFIVSVKPYHSGPQGRIRRSYPPIQSR